MQATKYNKRAGKRTKVIRCLRYKDKKPAYLSKDHGILHVLHWPYVFWKAVPDISYTALREWLEKKAAK